MNETTILEFKKGSTDLEDLLQFITHELSDEELDDLELEREQAPTSGFAGEPATIAAVITVSVSLTIAVTRLIERWLEKKSEEKQISLLIHAFTISPEAGAAVLALGQKYSDIALKMGLTNRSDLGNSTEHEK